MASENHLMMLKKGVSAWNRLWSSKHGLEFEPVPHSRGVSWPRAELSQADLSSANLSGAYLYLANLCQANLSHADLSDANLGGADLKCADLRAAKLNRADLSKADLRFAWLERATLTESNLSGADLSNVSLKGIDLSHANLLGANLSGADLSGASLFGADLREANLSGARLWGADVAYATFGSTVLADVVLSDVKGLDAAHHYRESSLGLDTFFRSNGKIPDVFLKGVGVPGVFFEYASSLVRKPFEFYSCFISYSVKDEEFASRLHNDLQAAGVRCWKWNHDARIGRSLWGEIDQAIRIHDKLVLVASEASLSSPAVNREIERALVQEDERLKRKLAGEAMSDGDVLFPVCVDHFVFNGWNHERKVDVTKKVIADACGWDRDPAVYANIRDKLIRDLKSGRQGPAVKLSLPSFKKTKHGE